MKKNKTKKSTKSTPVYNKGGQFWGDVAAGAVGVVGGAAGALLPGPLGSAAQQGIYAAHGAIDKNLTDEEKSIRGYGQAAGGITAGALTGNVAGAVQQGASGIGQGIASGSVGDPTAETLGMGLNSAGQVAGMAYGMKNPMQKQNLPTVTATSSPLYPTPTGKLRNGGQFGSYNNNSLLKTPKYIFNKGGEMCYPDGGMIEPLIEIEKQEVTRDPNGNITQYDGKPHSQGGIDIFAEGGTQIGSDSNSDRMKLPSTGKNMAQSWKPYQKQFNNIKKLKDKKFLTSEEQNHINIKSPELQNKFTDLFNEQEFVKQEKINKGVEKLYAKYGGKIPQYPNGGIKPPIINGMSGMDVTKYPIGIKQTASVIDSVMTPNGPKYPIYDVRGFIPNKEGFSNKENNPNYAPPGTIGMHQGTHEDYVYYGKNFPKQQIKHKNGGTQLPKYENAGWFPPMAPPTQAKEETNNFNWQNAAFQGGNFLAQNFGNLAYLKNEGKNYDKVNYGEIAPNLISDTAALNDATQAGNSAKMMIRDASGGNSGSYLGNIGQTQANLIQEKAKIRQNTANINAGIKNTTNMFNKQNYIQGMKDEAGNKGASLTNRYKALSGIGSNVAGQSRDIRFDNRDAELMKILPDLYKNPEFLALLEKYKK